jgi:hypothetical protein
MVIISNPTPARLQRFFKEWTLLMVQIRNASLLTICHEQGEAQNAANGGADGLQFTQANTGTLVAPPAFWWKGELWHIANGLGVQWSLEIIGSDSSAYGKTGAGPGCGGGG